MTITSEGEKRLRKKGNLRKHVKRADQAVPKNGAKRTVSLEDCESGNAAWALDRNRPTARITAFGGSLYPVAGPARLNYVAV